MIRTGGRRRGRRLLGALALVVLIIATTGSAALASTSSTGEQSTKVDRVLVISLPDIDWSDIDASELPNLRKLFASSAIGGMVTNGVLRPSDAGSSYVSLGAGARAVASPLTSGQGFGVDERFGLDSAGVVFRTRTGTVPGNGLVFLPIAEVIAENDAELYGAEVGALGDALAAARVSRAVIANGDGSDPSTPEVRVPPYRRAAVAALTTSAGRVPGGRVDRALLQTDATAPFGLRLDRATVMTAFRDAWHDQSVVLVEGSDLVRAALAASSASDGQATRMLDRALRDTDRLVGALLAEVDFARDAVMVVGPQAPNGDHGLTIASLRAPGVAPGLLTSTTTNHDGFVSITDVAPTILHLLGLDRPESMEGRFMETGASGGSLASRMQSLVDDNANGLLRDRQVGAAMSVVVILMVLLALAAVGCSRWWPKLRSLLVFGSLLLLAFLDATYLAGPFHFGEHGGAAAYWPTVAVISLVLVTIFAIAGKWLGHPVDALLVALGSVVVLHLGDLLTGAHLEWNTVFGYSPTIGIRFVGEGNLTFAQLVSAAVLFAGLAAWRIRAPYGLRVAIGVLVVTVVVMIAPFWGNDFGAALSAVPAFALMIWLLLGRRITVRSLVGIAAIGVGAVLAIGLLDLLRPAEQRTHVGKFFSQLFRDPTDATLVIRRKAAENLSVLGHSVLIFGIVIVAALIAYFWFVAPRRLRALPSLIPTTAATTVGFVAVAVLGFVLNDSGVTIPGIMASVLEATIVVLYARVLAESRT
ncbi:MAG: hypothetical protein ABWY77_03665 [Acidimicrobiia bacterium]